MKALLMRSYNPAEVVEVMQITKELIEECKTNIKKLTDFKNDEYEVKQILTYEDELILSESTTQKNDKFESSQNIDIRLKEGDTLIKTDIGYKVNLLPIKILTEKQEKHVEKYNKLGE